MHDFSIPDESIIGKNEFVSVYNEVYKAAQLLCAPFGVLSLSLLNEVSELVPLEKDVREMLENDTIHHYEKVFGEWEDVLIKRILLEKGYTQDQMSASISRYLYKSALHSNIQPDMEVSNYNIILST